MEQLQQTPIINQFEVARVAIMRESDGHLLVLWRADDDPNNAGLADLPGGGVEQDETWQRAAVRETFEETGLEIAEDDLQYIDEYVGQYPQEDGTVKVIHRKYALVTMPGDPPITTDPKEHKFGDFIPRQKAWQEFAYSASKTFAMGCIDRLIEATDLPATV